MWRRRELLGAMSTGAAGLTVLAAGARAQTADDREKHQAHGHDPRHAQMLRDCEEACGHCAAKCNETFHHCIRLAAEGKAHHAKMAQMVIDCAAFCTLSATLIGRHSSLMVESCRACAEACRRCADECASSETDAMMKACVEACRRCEESCRNMVRAMGGAHGREHGTERSAERRTQ